MRIAFRLRDKSGPPRISALAALPVFIDLGGKRALVFGGGAAAAWKAELLASAGASVSVFAPSAEYSDEMRWLLERGASAGALQHYDAPWRQADLTGAALVVAEARSRDEAGAVRDGVRAAGIPLNVIDRPDFCDFRFGSIVNRSPVVVGISTAGAAPILGQAVRRRIEMLLPPALACWGALARDLRGTVAARLVCGRRRRAFWERFSELAFATPAVPDADRTASALLRDARSGSAPGTGRVTIVGAGPGDAELLTLKALRALQAADVILSDDLVSGAVLELARREAKRIPVGKRAGQAGCGQDDINALMVTLARSGRRVVRLKSGDPMIFGRAGEEIAHLEAQGIPVDVVPGVTSALAMAAALRLSLTHREHAQSVRFITGHSRNGGLPDEIDWRSVADVQTTTVFYMGGRVAARIAQRLLDEGLSAKTPMVAMASVSRDGQRTWHGDLAALARHGIGVSDGAPVLIGVGGALSATDYRSRLPGDSLPSG